MGLTEQLRCPGSPVAEYFRQEYPHTRSLIRTANRELEMLPATHQFVELPGIKDVDVYLQAVPGFGVPTLI